MAAAPSPPAENCTAHDDADRADPTIPYNPVVGPPGPNASGRTTTTRTLTTLPPPDAGRIPLGGADAVRSPQRVRPLTGTAGRARPRTPTRRDARTSS